MLVSLKVSCFLQLWQFFTLCILLLKCRHKLITSTANVPINNMTHSHFLCRQELQVADSDESWRIITSSAVPLSSTEFYSIIQLIDLRFLACNFTVSHCVVTGAEQAAILSEKALKIFGTISV